MQVKICKQCKEEKTADYFSVVTSHYKGKITKYLNSYCKACFRDRFRATYVSRRLPRANRLYFKDAKKSINPITTLWPQRTPSVNYHREYPTCKTCNNKYITHCLLCKYGHYTSKKVS